MAVRHGHRHKNAVSKLPVAPRLSETVPKPGTEGFCQKYADLAIFWLDIGIDFW